MLDAEMDVLSLIERLLLAESRRSAFDTKRLYKLPGGITGSRLSLKFIHFKTAFLRREGAKIDYSKTEPFRYGDDDVSMVKLSIRYVLRAVDKFPGSLGGLCRLGGDDRSAAAARCREGSSQGLRRGDAAATLGRRDGHYRAAARVHKRHVTGCEHQSVVWLSDELPKERTGQSSTAKSTRPPPPTD